MAKRITRYTGGADPRRMPLGQLRIEYSDHVSAHEHRREMKELGFGELGTAMNGGPNGPIEVYYEFKPGEANG